jgi:hypothetical protein
MNSTLDTRPWKGVDLDGTLAEYTGWVSPYHIGDPVPLMVQRVKRWLANGERVKIFTARACQMQPDRNQVIAGIENWCLKHIGKVLEVTAEKDWFMTELWDDRAYTVGCNTGVVTSYPNITEL